MPQGEEIICFLKSAFTIQSSLVTRAHGPKFRLKVRPPSPLLGLLLLFSLSSSSPLSSSYSPLSLSSSSPLSFLCPLSSKAALPSPENLREKAQQSGSERTPSCRPSTCALCAFCARALGVLVAKGNSSTQRTKTVAPHSATLLKRPQRKQDRSGPFDC